MKVSIDFGVLDKALNTVSKAINDKLSVEEHKNVIFWFKNGILTLVGLNAAVTTTVLVDCLGVDGKSEEMHQVHMRELDKIVSAYKGLTRTKAEEIEFEFKENLVTIVVREEMLDGLELNSEHYSQSTRFSIPVLGIPERVKTVLTEVTEYKSEDTVVIPCASISRYLSMLAGPITRDGRDNASTRLYCMDKKIFTIPYNHADVMDNDLDDVFDNFKLSHRVVSYLCDFIVGCNEITVSKQERTESIVLIVDNGYAKAYLIAQPSNDTIRIPSEAGDVSQGKRITLDKYYFRDVLKRMAITEDIVSLSIDLDVGECVVKTKNVKQSVPLQSYEGEGVYQFTMTISLLMDLINNQSFLLPDIDIYFVEADSSVGLTITDGSVSKNGNCLWYISVRELECEDIETIE